MAATPNLAVVANPEMENEAKALLAARLGLFRPSTIEALKTAAQEAERAFLKSVSALTPAGGEAAVEKLIEEWKKVVAQRDRLAERIKAVTDIADQLDRRWDEIAAAQPSSTLAAYLEGHRKALEARHDEQGRALEFIAHELTWSEQKLRKVQEAAAGAEQREKSARK